MTFEEFAVSHGLIMRSLEIGRWCRVPTVDHPKKRNGAYKYLGDVGFVQNHATMVDVATWRPSGENAIRIDHQAIARKAEQVRQELVIAQQKAAQRASAILTECYIGLHPYLAKKGFPKHTGNIHVIDDKRYLVIPMRSGIELLGCQIVNEEGEKKFLSGQRTKGAEFRLGTSGRPVLCEGYATGLSIQAAMAAFPARSCVVVCFSAGNLQHVAQRYPDALVIADNDASGTGERVARATGLPWWMPDVVGEDFNDFHVRAGLYKAAQALKTVMNR